MIDMHSHILPGIDDGSENIEETIKMIKEAHEAGFTAIVSTSHFIEENYNVPKQKREEIIKKIQEILEKEDIDMQLYNGAEAYVITNLNTLIKEDILPTINDSRYLLMELPMNNRIIYLDNIIYDLKSNGIIPIIAHPERYVYVQKEPKILENLINQGVLFQANYGSIIGKYGKEAEKTVKKLLKIDVIHFLGTDTHRSNSTYTQMKQILKKFEKLIGKEKLETLSNTNPQKVLKNEVF